MATTDTVGTGAVSRGKVTTLADRKRADTLTAIMFMTPAIVVFMGFLIIPIAFALYISFTDWNGITPLGQSAAANTGLVVFTNETGDEIIIPARTEIQTRGDDPITFVTTEEVVVPPTSGEEEGTVQAPVEATISGRAGNIRRGILAVITDQALAEQVSVINPSAMQNGKDDPYRFTGTENYRNLLVKSGSTQTFFFRALKNTVYFVLGVVPVQTVLALLLAVIVNQRWLKARGFFRTAFYFPSITSSVVISLIFMWMFTQNGLINTIISAIYPGYQNINWFQDSTGVIHNILGVFGVDRQNIGDWANSRFVGLTIWDWISGPSVAMLTIMILNTWTTIGTLMIIYLAALQNIPGSVYEAAAIDGASGWQAFRRITVPLLTPTTFFVVTLGLIGTFQVFDQVFVITSGGPAFTTMTIAYIVYDSGFNQSSMGLAAATALILFVIIFTFTLIQRRITGETVET
jgi:multiple sugar transport system permease protein